MAAPSTTTATDERPAAAAIPAVRLEALTKVFGNDAAGRRVASTIAEATGSASLVAVDHVEPRRPRRGVLLDARAVRLRQDDDAPDDRRLRAADVGSHPPPWPRRVAPAALPARRQHGLPGLRAVSAHDRRRQRGLRPRGPEGPESRSRPTRRRGARHGPTDRVRQAPPRTAVGRTAAAGGPGAGARQPPSGAAPRRAPRRPGPEAPRGDADGAEADPAAGRDHVHLRDARPGGSAHDERPPRGVQSRADRAGRRAGGGLRAAGHRVRRRVRGDLEPAPRRRRPGGRRRAGDVHRSAREDPPGRAGRLRRRGRDVGPGHDPERRLSRSRHAVRRSARRRRRARRDPSRTSSHRRRTRWP